MAKTKKQPDKPVAGKGKPAFKGFLNYKPDKAAKTRIRESLIEPSGIEDFLWAICDTGHKLSVSRDQYHDTLQAAISTKEPTGDNAGWVLVVRHNDLLVLLTIIRFVVLDSALDGSWEDACFQDDQNDW